MDKQSGATVYMAYQAIVTMLYDTDEEGRRAPQNPPR